MSDAETIIIILAGSVCGSLVGVASVYIFGAGPSLGAVVGLGLGWLLARAFERPENKQ